MTIVYLIAIAVTTLLIDLWVEFVPTLPAGKAARYLRESTQAEVRELPGWRRWLQAFCGACCSWINDNIM